MNPQSAKERREERLFDSLEQSRVTRQHAAAKQRIRKKPLPDDTHAQRPPEKLPDPWLFDSESLLRELDRCRELVLEIPAPTHETHFAINVAIDGLWNLRETLRYLLGTHREGQRAFAQKSDAAPNKQKQPAPRRSAANRRITGIRA